MRAGHTITQHATAVHSLCVCLCVSVCCVVCIELRNIQCSLYRSLALRLCPSVVIHDIRMEWTLNARAHSLAYTLNDESVSAAVRAHTHTHGDAAHAMRTHRHGRIFTYIWPPSASSPSIGQYHCHSFGCVRAMDISFHFDFWGISQ